MNLKKWLFSNMFFRNMLTDFGERFAYSIEPGGFIPYFQYRIGSYQPDHYLYFPKEPYTIRYQNEIFNKLNEYKGYDTITFLEFHYAADMVDTEKIDELGFGICVTSQTIKIFD